MYDTIPDQFRKLAIENIFKTNTFNKCWLTWLPEIKKHLGMGYGENEIINLGDHLSDIFKSTGGGGRGQGELSASGTGWESLVCWYLNLCTIGSRIVAIRKMSLVPRAIQDAITVNYGNFATNTESDITIIIFPDAMEYNTDIAILNVLDSKGVLIPSTLKKKFNLELPNYLTERDFTKFEIGIIQCKTNWNDNAQIPMLWDMIYSAGTFRKGNLKIGKNNFAIKDAKDFTYSFVTVPSNNKVPHKAQGVAVKRVAHLSGGNYWGRPTTLNVAKSIKEIFSNNYANGSRTTLRTDIKKAIPELTGAKSLSYFGL